jgi:hypothetical protein
MSAIQVLHTDRVPATGFLCVPGRLDFQQLLHLEKQFSGRKITYLIEENDQHDPALRGHMEKSGNGAMFSCADKNAAKATASFFSSPAARPPDPPRRSMRHRVI